MIFLPCELRSEVRYSEPSRSSGGGGDGGGGCGCVIVLLLVGLAVWYFTQS